MSGEDHQERQNRRGRGLVDSGILCKRRAHWVLFLPISVPGFPESIPQEGAGRAQEPRPVLLAWVGQAAHRGTALGGKCDDEGDQKDQGAADSVAVQFLVASVEFA